MEPLIYEVVYITCQAPRSKLNAKTLNTEQPRKLRVAMPWFQERRKRKASDRYDERQRPFYNKEEYQWAGGVPVSDVRPLRVN